MTRVLGLLAAMTGLAACGGGGGADPLSFAMLEAEGNAILANAAPLDLISTSGAAGVTDPTTLRPSGSTTYNGVAAVQIINPGALDTELAADLSLTANFGNDTISGGMSNIVDNDNGLYAGQLSIENGEIDRTVNTVTTFTYDGDLTGQITSPDNTVFTSNAFLVGEFMGTNAEFIRGDIRGDITGGGETLTVTGQFVGQ